MPHPRHARATITTARVSSLPLHDAATRQATCIAAIIIGAAIFVTFFALPARGDMINLTNNDDTTLHTVNADFGGPGLVGNFHSQPAGTGVFKPFLTVERQSEGNNALDYERAYNTGGAPLYLDELRNHWNTYLRFGDLGTFKIGEAFYFAFELDANEPGAGKSLISIDNVRIYTSATDRTGLVQNDESKLNNLGTLRWAMNNPLHVNPSVPLKPTDLYNADEWINLDSVISAKQNGGSGISDMVLYVPVTAFAGTNPDDYVWFYNLNGLRESADYSPAPDGFDKDLAAESGYEEWRAFAGPQVVPDGGNTVILFGAALTAIGAIAAYRHRAKS
jgi:hypothetical protein